MTRIAMALKRRATGAERDDGFSLIELLVVVIIIGILAAIAVPIYIGVQNSSKDSSVKSDLTNAKLAVVAYYTDKGATAAAPALTAAGLGTYGFTKGGYTTTIAFKGTPTSTSFCIDATGATTNKFFTDASSGAVAGSCP